MTEVRGRFADVIIDIAHEKVDRPFTYRIPEEFCDELAEGSAVRVPFGQGNRERTGYITGFSDSPSCDPALVKDILGPETGKLPAEAVLIRLAAWMRKTYGGTMYACLRTVLPASDIKKDIVTRTLKLTVTEEEGRRILEEEEAKHHTARARLLSALLSDEGKSLSYGYVKDSLKVSLQTIRALEDSGVLEVTERTDYRNPVGILGDQPDTIELSAEQQGIVDAVTADYDAGTRGTYLIHGITGSGKTEVYIRMIAEMVKRGRQAIVLIPEIALTYQTLQRFYRYFRNRVSVMNSTLSPGERYDQARRAREGDIDVIIGPRSALFTPFPNTGLIIIDEEHETTYKSDQMPRYHARETAQELARLVPGGASVVLGSATPSMESYHNAVCGRYRLFELNRRLTGGELPVVETVDLRAELKRGNRSIFSVSLQEKLAQCLENGQQSMLFINRRGYAGFVSCRSCGHVFKCPHCDVSLSEHGTEDDDKLLVCHYCGYTQHAVKICPECGSRYVSAFRAGTQQIEREVKKLFPRARTLRMDADTTRTKGSFARILSEFEDHRADVLVGTQMIVKGHDFPDVTLVGILAADMSLNQSDYRAGERTFQLLTQAAGRAGRGDKPGYVVIQTYQPDHYSIIHAAAQDYKAFYEEEARYRSLMQYPPMSHLMAVQVFSRDEKTCIRAANTARAVMERAAAGKGAVFIGPAPAVISKIDDIFRYAVYVKHRDEETISGIREILEEYMADDPEKKAYSVQFDLDPMRGF